MTFALNQVQKASLVKRIIGVSKNTLKSIRRRLYCNFLIVPFAKKRHSLINKSVQRSQKHTYTAFNRSPGQLEALCGPVLETLNLSKASNVLQINILAGSIGAESYTLASALSAKYPDLNFHIHCCDLHDVTVTRSNLGRYTQQEVHGLGVTKQFIDNTFIAESNDYIVKPALKNKVSFFKANIITDNLEMVYPKADIVLIQNVLFHLDDDQAETAFANGLKTAKNNAAIFIDGMSLNMREKLVSQNNLKPLDFKVKEIHEYARRHVPDNWWEYYYGMEPYSFFSANRLNRYCTIFFR